VDCPVPWLGTARLVAWVPTAADEPAVWAVHSDPDTYRHVPSARLTRHEDAARLLSTWMDHWDRHGFGYATVRSVDDPTVLGFAGARFAALNGAEVLNLYYRFAPRAWGVGYATEIARAVAQWAAAEHPTVPLIARVATNNPSSVRVAERIGLVRTDLQDRSDEVDHLIFASRPVQEPTPSTLRAAIPPTSQGAWR